MSALTGPARVARSTASAEWAPATAQAVQVSAPRVARPSAPDIEARDRRREWWTLGATAVIWLTSLLVVVLWVLGAEVQALVGSGAEALNSIGRLTGLVSANLLLYQVLLMARVPLFERGFGRDGLVRMHRIVGMWSFLLLAAHIVLLVVGYAWVSGQNVLAQAWQFVWDYPGMLLATVGTLLILLVGLTSARRARKRLRFESWHLLHLYGYLGVGLAIPHMLWTGADFVGNPWASTYWWAMWAVTAAAVVVFRVGVPLVRSLRHRIVVAGVDPDGPRGVRVRMQGRDLRKLHTRPGQFFVWRFMDGAGWSRGHPFSLAAAPRGNELVISAQVVGDGTARLAGVRPGTRVLIEGPYGRLTGDERRPGKLLMLGAGFGVAPLISLLEGESYDPGDAVLVTRDHEPGDAMGRDAIASLVRDRGLQHIALDGPRVREGSTWLPAAYGAWRGADMIRYLAPDLEHTDIYLCGPGAWSNAVYSDLLAAGARRDRIHRESFSID